MSFKLLHKVQIGDEFICKDEVLYISKDYVDDGIMTRKDFEEKACTVLCEKGFIGKVENVDHDEKYISILILDLDRDVYADLEVFYEDDNSFEGFDIYFSPGAEQISEFLKRDSNV
jgi:hypothetical protein